MIRNITFIGLIIVMMFGLTACSKVPAGHVGVKVHMLGSSKGVDWEEVSPGRYWIGPNTELYIFPTFTQNYVWTRDPMEGSKNNEEISFQTVEGMSVQADVGISYHIDNDHVGMIFEKYRKGIEEITDIYMRNMVRDAFVQIASTLEIETVYGVGKSKMVDSVEQLVRDQCDPIGIVVEKIYLIGDLRLPTSIVDALNNKIAATQRAQQRENEVREAEAEAQKKIAEAEGQAQSILRVAKAQAEANQILAKSLTKDLVEYKAIESWNGQLPQYTGGGAVPFINVNGK